MPISLGVEVDPKLAGADQGGGFKATGTIDRRDFGMNAGYPIISGGPIGEAGVNSRRGVY
jgi:polyisoprenoid-binding protein YceI